VFLRVQKGGPYGLGKKYQGTSQERGGADKTFGSEEIPCTGSNKKKKKKPEQKSQRGESLKVKRLSSIAELPKDRSFVLLIGHHQKRGKRNTKRTRKGKGLGKKKSSVVR